MDGRGVADILVVDKEAVGSLVTIFPPEVATEGAQRLKASRRGHEPCGSV